jgi:hypothetical protein
MIRTLCILTVFIAVSFTASPAAQNAWGESGDVSELQAIQPGSCQQEIVELQNILHAANQTIESLVGENRELRETIERIRREVDRGGYMDQPRAL